LEPAKTVSELSLAAEERELEQLSERFQEWKKAAREQCKRYREGRIAEKPNVDNLNELIKECQEKILRAWSDINGICNTIYAQRKQFFEDRKKFDNKQNKLVKVMNKLEEDAYIFTVPGKFPEAYRKTIDELQRRKSYNIAAEKVCYLFQKVMKSERKQRDNFNGKYGDYLPVSIQEDLQLQPIDILFND